MEYSNSYCQYFVETDYGPDAPIMGTSRLAEELREAIGILENNEDGIMLQGEYGTGRVFVAMRIHFNSIRKAKPFVILDCAVEPLRNIEESLNGEGGKFQEAEGGTLLIENITKLPANTQKRVFDFLFKGKPDIRIICSSPEDVKKKINMGMFRADLCKEICPYTLVLPPLRNRPEDIPRQTTVCLREPVLSMSKGARGR